MLYGLASFPPSIWQQEHLAHLDSIFEAALNAADLQSSYWQSCRIFSAECPYRFIPSGLQNG